MTNTPSSIRTRTTAAVAGVALVVAACSGAEATVAEDAADLESTTTTAETEQTSTTEAASNDGVDTADEQPGEVEAAFSGALKLDDTHADDNDGEYDEADAVTIALADRVTSVTGDGATVDGDVISITEPGTYVLSGELTDGQIVVNSLEDGKVRLVLDGVDVTSATTSPIVFSEADEAVVVLASGSINTLSDAAASAADDELEDAPNATLFSMADLTIVGDGELNVTGLSNDAITSKDGLVILSGNINVDAIDDGIRGKDYLYVVDGVISVVAGGDGLKSDNDNIDSFGWIQIEDGSVTVFAGAQGIDGWGAVTITGGDIDVEESLEGIQAMAITVAGGTTDVTAIDDGINATAHTVDEGANEVEEGVEFTMTSGTLTVSAGFDGLDSNGNATITGGTLAITSGEPTTGGNGALDVNGTIVAPGVITIASDSITAGDRVTIVNSNEEITASVVTTADGLSLTLTATDIVVGETYTVYAGANDSGDSLDGLSEIGTATAAEATELLAVGRGGGGTGGGPAAGGGERPAGGAGR